jgi:regulator of replication initiation timing
VSENKVLRRVFGTKREAGEDCVMKVSLLLRLNRHYSGDETKEDEMGEHVARMGEMRNTIFWLENQKGRVHLEDLGLDGTVILEWISGK